MIDVIDVIGLIGVIGILITYFLLQASLMRVSDLSYSMINGIGALMILYSLLYNWNTSSVVIEIFWFGISVYGIIKQWRSRKFR